MLPGGVNRFTPVLKGINYNWEFMLMAMDQVQELISLSYVHLMKGEHDDKLSFPFNANITVQLLNWVSDSHHREMTIHHHTAPLYCRVRVTEGVTAPGGMWLWTVHITHSTTRL